MKSIHTLILPGMVLFMLAACGDLRDDLGLGRSAPDEFAVVDRAPLSVPPDFSLRPPQPGAKRPQEVDMTQRANNIVFGGDTAAANSAPGASSAENTLLTSAGAAKADSNIRETVDREAAQKVVGNEHLVDELLWWKKAPLPGIVVDPAAEAARIKEAKEKGVPLNQGQPPLSKSRNPAGLAYNDQARHRFRFHSYSFAVYRACRRVFS